MDIKIMPTALSGSVHAIPSKSHAHRLLIAAALCKEPCEVPISQASEDLEATKNCLLSLDSPSPIFHCEESGSTLRLMLPVAMALKKKAVFLGRGRLPSRPLSPLKEEMAGHGCRFARHDDEICTVTGQLEGGIFQLPGNISSQYITGLLLALPLVPQSSRIMLTSTLESQGYVHLTLQVLRQFGIHVEVTATKGHYVFSIPGNQQYHSPGKITPEGDWSNSAFWIVADALCGSVHCDGLSIDSLQGDRVIAAFHQNYSKPCNTSVFTIDASNIPDLIPPLAVLACSVNGTTHITNAYRLRLKESDRLSTIHAMVAALGGNITQTEDGLCIHGTKSLKGGTVNGNGDHRIVMAAAIASILCENPVVIRGAEAVNKSYPAFFTDFERLGGIYHVIS